MNKNIFQQIQNRLSEIEKEHRVKILYALESGSRAWGFESTDSDYDVRFIYCHEKDWYLSILPGRDVIEYPIIDEFDYSGWDLRKSMFLFNKSNPVLFEWLHSPIIYHKENFFFNEMKKLAQIYFSPLSSMYHYLHMAKRNYREYLLTSQVKIKKYFYVLRPVLACLWIKEKNEIPPVEFEQLLSLITDNVLLDRIQELLDKKRSGIEMGLEPKIEKINDYLNQQITFIEENVTEFDPREKTDSSILNRIFIKILNHYQDLEINN